ncbi:MAG TPA: phosphatase PAP2 family protein [Anaeromyxobacter sp.]
MSPPIVRRRFTGVCMSFLYAFDPFVAVQHVLERPWLDPVMATLSQLCQGWVVALFALAWAVAVGRTRQGILRAGVPILLALAVDGALVQALKIALHTPRPLAVLGADHVHVLLSPLRAHSMPSGHASAAATLAAYLGGRRRREGAVAWPLALLGGISRVYVGAHWVIDVVAGWLVGAIVGHAAARVAANRRALSAPAASAPAGATPP